MWNKFLNWLRDKLGPTTRVQALLDHMEDVAGSKQGKCRIYKSGEFNIVLFGEDGQEHLDEKTKETLKPSFNTEEEAEAFIKGFNLAYDFIFSSYPFQKQDKPFNISPVVTSDDLKLN